MSEPKFLIVPYLCAKDLKRIFSKISVNPATNCWEWTAALNHNGYGKVHFKSRSETSHRLMYAWLVEPIPMGVAADIPNLDHTCENRRCCNPAHLVLKLPKYNTLRSKTNFAAVNSRKTHCPQGHPLNTVVEWKQGRKRPCPICHNDQAKARRKTEDGHERFLEYHRNYRERDGIRERNRDATRRFRERQRLKAGGQSD